MKAIFFIFITALCSSVYGQDCEDITMEVDKFKGDTIYTSPYLSSVHFVRYKGKNAGSFLVLTAYGSTYNAGIKGVIVLLDSGKLEWPEQKIDGDVASGAYSGFSFTSFIPLTDSELETLSKRKITDFQLYIYDVTLKEKYQEKYRNYARCILSK
jgi:hypothetical protein